MKSPHGVLNLLKPPGPSSNAVVQRLRRLLSAGKAGHAGTLDPPAAGVLVILLGRATRIAECLVSEEKSYRVEITFGLGTHTYDAAGRVTERSEASWLTSERLEAVLPGFRGWIRQTPPPVSAVKINGERLYRLTRQEREISVAPRQVNIKSLRLLSFRGGGHPVAMLDLTCSKGTYVRSLAHDLGKTLGTGAHVSFLLRLAVGDLRLEEAVTVEEVEDAAVRGNLPDLIRPLEQVLGFLPEIRLGPAEVAGVICGRAPRDLDVRGGDGWLRLADLDGRVVALGRSEGEEGGVRLAKVFPPEEVGRGR